MIFKYKLIYVSVLFLMLLLGCKSEYTKSVENGLKSGIVHDSLIFDMKIGQTKKDFYSVCWDLNKRKLISEGPGNLSAKFIEPIDSTRENLYRKQMLFYGIFDEDDVMQGMQMTYTYVLWSPWNQAMQATNLTTDLLKFYEKHYPSSTFFEVDLGIKNYKAYAKIDGNRQITIYPTTEKDVVVKIENLNHKLKKK